MIKIHNVIKKYYIQKKSLIIIIIINNEINFTKYQNDDHKYDKQNKFYRNQFYDQNKCLNKEYISKMK